MLFRRRLVRLHLIDPFPSIEGIWTNHGSVSADGHYRLLKPAVIAATDQTRPIDGEVWVPRERVIFVQRLA